jgi:hypothetical protein
MNREDCEGCKDENKDKDGCSWFNKTVICPCSTCLIKVMCTIPCGLFSRHIIETYEDN